jgi:hypothetical protein
MTEEPISEYDEGEIPERKAKEILDSPEENEEYFPCPYDYFFNDRKIDREIFNDLKQEIKKPELLTKKLKTQDELEKEIMDDSFTYESEWDFFLEDLSGIMQTKNGDGDWETPCTDAKDDCTITNKKDGTGSLVCYVGREKIGKELIYKVLDFDRFRYGTGPIRIFDYKKNGMKIRAQSHDEIFLLPACRSGFIRDWDKDGVCIEIVEEE